MFLSLPLALLLMCSCALSQINQSLKREIYFLTLKIKVDFEGKEIGIPLTIITTKFSGLLLLLFFNVAPFDCKRNCCELG